MADGSAFRFGPDESSAALTLAQVALAEDLGSVGDITSRALVPDGQLGAAWLVARQAGTVAGLEAARMVLTQVDGTLVWEWGCRDGACVQRGTQLARVSGKLQSLLAGERVALNILQRLSGVASITGRFVDTVAGLPCKIIDTRKTTPGLRILEKYAVRVGGGHNHRMGLYDAVLIKDNHLVACRTRSPDLSLSTIVHLARTATQQGTTIELEVDSIEQFEQSIPGNPHIILLDNMSLEQLREAVALRNRLAPRILLEASGGVTLESVRQVAETGVDRISVGALTHSAPALDIAFDFEEPGA